jgi:hypothetical protein
MVKKSAVLVFVVFSVFVLVQGARAQTTTAVLAGSVTDETGAVLPGAQVTVTNTATAVKRAVTTNAAGRFIRSRNSPPVLTSLPSLRPGSRHWSAKALRSPSARKPASRCR